MIKFEEKKNQNKMTNLFFGITVRHQSSYVPYHLEELTMMLPTKPTVAMFHHRR
jgi:hypothetical protein